MDPHTWRRATAPVLSEPDSGNIVLDLGGRKQAERAQSERVEMAVAQLGSQTAPVLLRLPFSHYCKKAEWGLSIAGIEYSRLDVGLPQMRQVRRANPVKRTVPVLAVEKELHQDSHEILRWCDNHRGDRVPSFYPEALAQQVVDWEDWTDEVLGPLIRRLAYRVLARDPAAYGNTRRQRWALRLRRPLFRAVSRYLKVNQHAKEDDARLDEVVSRIAQRLEQTGTGYLFTDHLTGADVATAALIRPLVPVARVWALDENPAWAPVERLIEAVRPAKPHAVSTRRVRENDWEAFEVLNQAHGTLSRPTADEYK